MFCVGGWVAVAVLYMMQLWAFMGVAAAGAVVAMVRRVFAGFNIERYKTFGDLYLYLVDWMWDLGVVVFDLLIVAYVIWQHILHCIGAICGC